MRPYRPANLPPGRASSRAKRDKGPAGGGHDRGRHGQGVITGEADTLGRFSADEFPFGQISLRCRLGSDQSPVVTGWITR